MSAYSSDTTRSVVPTTFLRFQQLPAELRLKIWNAALPGARTIHLVSLGRGPGARRCVATMPCPRIIYSLLQACVESRHEVLTRYELLLSSETPEPFFGTHYFDPLRDGVFIDQLWPWMRGTIDTPSGVLKARHLSMSCNTWWDAWTASSPQLLGKEGLLRFKQLEEIHIIFRVLAEHERERFKQSKCVQLIATTYRPLDIAFPGIGVNIRVDTIVEKFAMMKKANPDWKVPKVKLMAWATAPDPDP
jgi:hypothetical protein